MATYRDVETINGKRCNGLCCARFSLPYPPEHFQENAGKICDGEKLKEMLVYLGPSEYGTNGDKTGGVGHYYTCNKYDPKAPDGMCCTDYANRPQVCREFPEYGIPGRQCPYDGCASHGFLRRWRLTRPLYKKVQSAVDSIKGRIERKRRRRLDKILLKVDPPEDEQKEIVPAGVDEYEAKLEPEGELK